jgi:hypothetical protein
MTILSRNESHNLPNQYFAEHAAINAVKNTMNNDFNKNQRITIMIEITRYAGQGLTPEDTTFSVISKVKTGKMP